MAKPLRPIVRSGGFYPSRKYTPLVYPGGYTTLNAKNGKPDPLNTISGSIVRFISNHVKPFVKTVANIEPVQDMNGYANPWPAGGGKNIFNYEVADYKNGYLLNSSGNESENGSYRYTQNYLEVSPSTAYTGQANKTTSTSTGMTVCEYDENKTFIKRSVFYAATSGKGVKSGTITTEATTKYIRFSVGIGTEYVMIERGSEASAFEPYKNICPIKGWTKCGIMHTNKNIFGGNLLRDGILNNVNNSVDYPDDKYVLFSASASANWAITKDTLTIYNGDERIGSRFKEDTQYTFIMTLYKPSGGTGSNLMVYYMDGTYEYIPSVSAIETKETIIFVSAEGKTVRGLNKRNSSGSTQVYYDESGIFEGALTADDFVAYQGTTKTITFPDSAGTVYGSSFTINDDGTGKLSIGKFGVDLGTLSWAMGNSATHTIYAPLSNCAHKAEIICGTYKYLGWYTASSKVNETGIYSFSSYNGIGIRDDRYDVSTPEGISAFAASLNGVIAVYTTNHPVEYDLTVDQMQTLLGENNVWATTGDITVEVIGTPIVEPDADVLTSLNILLGGTYSNMGQPDEATDEEAFNILLGGADR